MVESRLHSLRNCTRHFFELNHINFDWFRPLNCHRHTREEILTWCAEADLDILHLNVQDAGITVVAQKQ